MEYLGYLCAAIVGISLGIFGSGGSILTVPIMVYMMNINPVEATGYSLFVVGITSATGAISYVRRKMVNFNTALIFGVPSIICVFLTRKFLMPAIPPVLFSNGSTIITKEIMIMIVFAFLMLYIGYTMLQQASTIETPLNAYSNNKLLRLFMVGIAAGILTGIMGVGGGFIIIPALVLYAKIPVRMSVGTSLIIIAFNSLSGFVEEFISRHAVLDFKFLLLFSLFSIAGIYIGFPLSLKFNTSQLKRLYGWFIMIMGIAVFIKEVFFPFD